ncbi:hypothetical protein T4E_436 [Trichinella pseudospiralis]|uniref:Uncharacterized protein n=1 Tax=Trichinella pseudospiralis TaxID=6337 RepID=A0A0V0Y1P0_TRIPS|nr:hypothetical protein T4E_436 [Trichinella pseudospiralis]
MQTLKMLINYKGRLHQLSEEVEHLCKEPSKVFEIEEQISMIERLYRKTNGLQVELTFGVEKKEQKIAGDNWSKYHMCSESAKQER